ncbi:MAG: type I-B CRISPR-associated protein Cas7/Cst2/DevR [Caldisericum sp.]
MDKKTVMPPKGLTLSVIFDGMSLNYGEGIGNISELKKIYRASEIFSYLSRQAIRHEVYRLLKELFDIDVGVGEPLTTEQKVIQFKPNATIEQYVELDLFGYMKTKGKNKSSKNKQKSSTGAQEGTAEQDNASGEESEESSGSSLIRTAVVRINPAVSLEPMLLDMEFGTNLDFARRAGADPNPFQVEHHSSLYAYTITVELDRVGIDPNDGIVLSAQEKARRVNLLLDAVKFLNRNIRGRMENLNPLFVIGGVYDVKNPFFLGRLRVQYNNTSRKYLVDTELLSSVLEITFNNKAVKDDTYIGFIKGYWENEKNIQSLVPEQQSGSVNHFFEILKAKVKQYYGV